jgi:mannose-1-phosphate guanylyltransferase
LRAKDIASGLTLVVTNEEHHFLAFEQLRETLNGANGELTWNSGMFVLKTNTWLKALQQFHPDILTSTQVAWVGKTTNISFVRPNKRSLFPKCRQSPSTTR